MDVKEGFLCPICKIDLHSMNKLHNHFYEEHSDDLRIKKLLIGFMGQAKKIIKQNNETDDSFSKSRKEIIHSLEIYNVPYQEIGLSRNHFEEFQKMRNRRLEDIAIETNRLIIRLDKLLTNLPSDPNKRKMHEQTIVSWLDGGDVSRCPECTKPFNLARRQHHCRLCGSVMCHSCSVFLPISKANEIVSGVSNDVTDGGEKNEDSLRICNYCFNHLENREMMKANRNCCPLISELYDQVRTFIKELDKDADLYMDMSLSLNEGKSAYNLFDAQKLWDKIMRSSEKIGFMSSKLAALGMNEDPCKLSAREIRLQKAVAMGVNDYIQSRILALPRLQSEDVYRQLQEKRRREREKEINEQKREELTDAFLSSQIRTEYVHHKPTLSKLQNNDTSEDGWIPDTNSKIYNDDPIIVQMNNIRSYIKQAREMYKFDEVASLEENLRELQKEYYRQQS